MKRALNPQGTSNIKHLTLNIELFLRVAPRPEFGGRCSAFDVFNTFRSLAILTFLSAAAFANAQDNRTNATPHVYRDQVEAHWFSAADGETNQFWYRVNVASNRYEFILVDAQKGSRAPAFDHARLANAFTEQTAGTVEPQQLPFTSIRFSGDGKSVRLIATNAAWQCDLATYQLSEAPFDDTDRPGERPASGRRGRRGGGQRGPGPGTTNAVVRGIRSPDGKWEAVVRGHNLFLRDTNSGKEQPLTHDANPTSSYARNAEADRSVEMNFETRDPETPIPEAYWSPDSKHLVAMRHKPGTERRVYLINSSPDDQLQPRLDSYPYLKPGDDVPIRKPHLFDVEARKEIPVDDALFPNPWSVGELRWSPDSSRFTFLYNQRGHQALRIIAVNAQSGETRAIVDEQSKTFINYSGKYFAEYLDDADEIVWMSERDGWTHLYLYDSKTGRVKNQITKGEWVVRGVDRVDREKRQIWFHAGGIRPQEDPYYVHYCKANFDGTGLVVLTEGDANHSAQFSPDYRFLVDTWSRVDRPPVTELRRGDDGKLLCKLEETDTSELSAAGWKPPERFVAKGRDGSTDIYGVVFRPKNFSAAKKYPVIENIYAGPQSFFTPKTFRVSYQHQRLADRGFVVVQMDGMGTAERSKKFHDVCFKNLGDSGFPDRILWIKAAAAKYPFMDLTRVGLYGTSAGAQNALRGMLDHGDFYKACVSDCGCHDNRMDKIWWNEQWMGWPVDESYVRSSNVEDAHKLQGKLLLMVGEMDHNVDPSSTMQVVNALIKADKDFEFLEMPGADHGVARTPYGARRLEEFFVKTFLGDEPVSEPKTSTTSSTR